MAWTTADSVRERIRQASASFGWEDAEVDLRIARAETRLKTWFIPRYSATEVAKWDIVATCPDLIEILAADQAAVYIFQDAYGQSPLEPGTPGGNLQESIKNRLEELAKSDLVLCLDDGTMIMPVDTNIGQPYSTTEDMEPIYTIGRQALDTSKPGSLDGF